MIEIEIIENPADIQNALARGYRIERIVAGKLYLTNPTRAEVFAEELGGKKKTIILALKAEGLTLREIGNRVGLSHGTVWKILRGA